MAQPSGPNAVSVFRMLCRIENRNLPAHEAVDKINGLTDALTTDQKGIIPQIALQIISDIDHFSEMDPAREDYRVYRINDLAPEDKQLIQSAVQNFLNALHKKGAVEASAYCQYISELRRHLALELTLSDDLTLEQIEVRDNELWSSIAQKLGFGSIRAEETDRSGVVKAQVMERVAMLLRRISQLPTNKIPADMQVLLLKPLTLASIRSLQKWMG